MSICLILRKEILLMANICSRCGQEIKNLLRKITQGLVLDPTDGKEILANAKDTFSGIDSDFKNWGLDKKGSATDTQAVDVYEIATDATFRQIFDSFLNSLDQVCLTQAQIKQFVKKHRQELRTDGGGTFFLFKEGNHFFVARVYVSSDGAPWVGVRRLEDVRVWCAGRRPRLVVPQLAV
jgi:hypothetical protein